MSQAEIDEWNKTKPTTHDESQMGYGRSEYEARKASEKVWNNPNAHVELDSLPNRMADKMDAKISGLEAKQTKWFVGITISTAIGGLSLIIGAIGLIVNIFI